LNCWSRINQRHLIGKILMRLAWLLLPFVLTGCGNEKAAATLTVSCGEETSLNGATSIEVLVDQRSGRTILSYPDPANQDQTGTIAVTPQDRCKILPATASGASSEQR
jgi:hypothetical protein